MVSLWSTTGAQSAPDWSEGSGSDLGLERALRERQVREKVASERVERLLLLPKDEAIALLLESGYCRLLQTQGLVGRIDREDWMAVAIQDLPMNLEDVIRDNEQDPPVNAWGSFYRRAYSEDTLTLPRDLAAEIHEDGPGQNQFLPLSPRLCQVFEGSGR